MSAAPTNAIVNAARTLMKTRTGTHTTVAFNPKPNQAIIPPRMTRPIPSSSSLVTTAAIGKISRGKYTFRMRLACWTTLTTPSLADS